MYVLLSFVLVLPVKKLLKVGIICNPFRDSSLIIFPGTFFPDVNEVEPEVYRVTQLAMNYTFNMPPPTEMVIALRMPRYSSMQGPIFIISLSVQSIWPSQLAG